MNEESYNVLFLDDDPIRWSSFEPAIQIFGTKNGFNIDVIWVTSVNSAKDALSNRLFDSVFLDHDLGGVPFVDSGPGTGYEVAEFILEELDYLPPQIIIHSLNPAGSQNMQRVLPTSRIIPFPILLKEIQ